MSTATLIEKAKDKMAAIKARQMARRLAGGLPDDAHDAAVRGIGIYADRFGRAGDVETAEKLRQMATEAGDLLAREKTLNDESGKPRIDHLGDAIGAAAVELCKKLPSCFPSLADAESFARDRLPMLDASKAARADTDARAKLAKAAATAHHSAAAIIDMAATLATGDIDTRAAFRTLAEKGA